MPVNYWKLMLRWDNELGQIRVIVRWVNHALGKPCVPVSPNENKATLSIYVQTGPVLPAVTAPIVRFRAHSNKSVNRVEYLFSFLLDTRWDRIRLLPILPSCSSLQTENLNAYTVLYTCVIGSVSLRTRSSVLTH